MKHKTNKIDIHKKANEGCAVVVNNTVLGILYDGGHGNITVYNGCYFDKYKTVGHAINAILINNYCKRLSGDRLAALAAKVKE